MKNTRGSLLKRTDSVILGTLKVITITSFIILTILISANVFVRFVPIASLHWFDEIIELVYAYLVFYGAAALWITRGHISVGDWMSERIIKNARTRHFYRMVLELLVLFFTVIFFYYSLKLTILALDVTNVFAIPKKILYSCLPISGAIMVIYTLRNMAVEMVGMTKSRQEEEKHV